MASAANDQSLLDSKVSLFQIRNGYIILGIIISSNLISELDRYIRKNYDISPNIPSIKNFGVLNISHDNSQIHSEVIFIEKE